MLLESDIKKALASEKQICEMHLKENNLENALICYGRILAYQHVLGIPGENSSDYLLTEYFKTARSVKTSAN